jgi:hypothetical protein
MKADLARTAEHASMQQTNVEQQVESEQMSNERSLEAKSASPRAA